MGVLDEYNERIKEKVKRLEFMDGNDILSMDLLFIRRLADFGNIELVRRIVAKGDSKLQKKQILEKLKEVYQRDYWYEYVSWSEHGYTEEQPWYFNDIAYDIETNTPLLPDEEKTLPNPNSSPSGEAGRGLLEARIAELEKENEALKQQIEELQSQPLTSEVQQASTNEALVELLSYVMYEDEKNAKEFIESAKGRSDVEITDLVAQWVDENKISSKSCRRDLWRLLHAYKLYSGTESNYNTAMRKKQ